MLAEPADYVHQLACQFCRNASFAVDCGLPKVAKGGQLAACLVSAAYTTPSVL
jgi:hypothetical protein